MKRHPLERIVRLLACKLTGHRYVVAPELLEALQAMIDYYGSASANVEALTAARAAIAKATGETE